MKRALEGLEGVKEVEVNFDEKAAVVKADPARLAPGKLVDGFNEAQGRFRAALRGLEVHWRNDAFELTVVPTFRPKKAGGTLELALVVEGDRPDGLTFQFEAPEGVELPDRAPARAARTAVSGRVDPKLEPGDYRIQIRLTTGSETLGTVPVPCLLAP